MDSLLLVLIIGLVTMALINAASLVWAGYLDHKLRRRPTPKHYDVHVEGTKVFPEVDRQAVEARAEQLLAEAVNSAAKKLQVSVDTIAGEVAEHIRHTAAQELEAYHANLQSVNKQSVAAFQTLETEIAKRRQQLLQQLDAEIAAEKTKRMDAFTAKLNDVVASYVVESLGNQVDIGAEAPYVFEVLTTHKEDIKRDVLS